LEFLTSRNRFLSVINSGPGNIPFRELSPSRDSSFKKFRFSRNCFLSNLHSCKGGDPFLEFTASFEEQSFDEAVNSRKGFSRTGEELEKEQSSDSLTPQGDKSRD
jgi:hypothetical protein